MKIYVASSWRNEYQHKVVDKLRELGHEVYDFRNPKDDDHGFHWSEIDPLWETWTPEEYYKALSHPIAEKGFKADFDAMKWADCCVMVLPCGRSANTEAGWMKGAGKEVYVYIPIQQEPELMYKIYDKVLTNFWELEYIGRKCYGDVLKDCSAFGNMEGRACNHCSKFGLSQLPAKDKGVTDEKVILLSFAEYWNTTFDKDPVSHIYKSAIENFMGLHPEKRKWLIDMLIRNGSIPASGKADKVDEEFKSPLKKYNDLRDSYRE